MSTREPYTEIRTMNKGRPSEFDRIYLFCPDSHEVVSAPVVPMSNATARRLLAGDFSGEFCAHGLCEWKA